MPETIRIRDLTETTTPIGEYVFAVEVNSDPLIVTKKIELDTIKDYINADEGDVSGPDISVSGNIVAFDGITGKLIKDSGHTLSEYVTIDQSTPQTIGTTGDRVTKIWAEDLTVTNTIYGNASTSSELSTDGTGTQAWRMSGGVQGWHNVIETGGTVTSVSVATANGISGTVADSTTTPAITLALGNITPTTVNGLTLDSDAIGFNISGGTTSKTLAVPLDASVSGTNTGDNSPNSSVTHVGTTEIALNRASNTQSLTGVSIDGNAGTVTNATLTTALTVNTGTVTLSGNSANTSTLTIGAGSVSVSGTNTGDQDLSGLVTVAQITPQSIGDTTNRLTKLWSKSIDVTIVGDTTTTKGLYSNTSSTTGNSFGLDQVVNTSDSGQCFGLNQSVYSTGSGQCFGLNQAVYGYTGYIYGLRNNIFRTGDGRSYGLSQTVTGQNNYSFGIDQTVNGSSTAHAHYGLYQIVTGGLTNYGIYSTATYDYLNSKLGLGITVPTAIINIKAGTATAGTAPIKLTQASSVVMTSPEPGAIECNDGDELYYTIKTGSARKTIAYTDGNITGSAATLTTTRTIFGQNFNGSANVAGTATISNIGLLGSSPVTTSGIYAAQNYDNPAVTI